MTPETEALKYYRKLVSFIYREVGAMKRDNHPELYDRSNISLVHSKRKEDAKRFYHESKTQNDVGLIDQSYVEWSGLTLEDVLKVFQEGDWLLGRKSHSFGGPKWAKVTETTLALREAITSEEWQRIPRLVDEIKNLRHNSGLVINKFKELNL